MAIPPPASRSFEPVRVAWDAAPGVIRARADALAVRVCRPVVIAICGPVGAGKSTLAGALDGAVLRTDDYLPEYDATPEPERDLPHRADVARLLADLAMLRRRERAIVPVWSFHTHKREGERAVDAHERIVLEGIHALHEPVRALLDIKVFVEAPSLVRWRRWEVLESTGVRGWGVEKARAYFHGIAEPTFARFEPHYRAAADVVVVNAGPA